MTTTGLQLKLFMGTLFTPEIKMYTEQNIFWQQEKVSKMAGQESRLLLESTPFQNKEYIGIYIKETSPSLLELEAYKKQVEEQLAEFADPIVNRNIHLKLFSLVLIA